MAIIRMIPTPSKDCGITAASRQPQLPNRLHTEHMFGRNMVRGECRPCKLCMLHCEPIKDATASSGDCRGIEKVAALLLREQSCLFTM